LCLGSPGQCRIRTPYILEKKNSKAYKISSQNSCYRASIYLVNQMNIGYTERTNCPKVWIKHCQVCIENIEGWYSHSIVMSKYANSCSLSSTSRRSCQVNYTLGRVHEKSLKFEIDANEVTKRKLAGFTQVSIYSHSSKTVNTWETLWNVYCFATNQVWDETKKITAKLHMDWS